jgi:diguanylate cyclase (GGDEF)-like protein/PAS domain S-box-containing protein
MSATRDAVRGSVLVVVLDRDDRRALFETLDRYDFDAIYTAKDFQQAHAMLEQNPPLDALLVEFAGEATEAFALCAALERHASLSQVPVIGIASAVALQGRWGWSAEPHVVVDWLRSPVLGEEALHRIQRVLQAGAGVTAVRPPASLTAALASVETMALFSAHPDPVVLWDPASGVMLGVNPAFLERCGGSESQWVGRSIDTLDLTHDARERARLRAELKREGQQALRHELMLVDRSRRWVEARTRVFQQGRDSLCLTAYRDSSGVPQLEAALRVGAAISAASGPDTLRIVATQLMAWLAPDQIWVVLRRTEQGEEPAVLHQQGRALRSDPSPAHWASLLKRVGEGDVLVLGERASRTLAAEPLVAEARFEALLAAPLRDEREARIGALVLAAQRPLNLPAGVEDTLRVAAARIAHEVELQRAREQGRAKGLQDSLTGLPNRLLFNDRLETTLKEAQRTGETFAVLFVDLDRFKTINDSLGHGVGDEVLSAVAKRLRQSVRGSDTVARYAGDEFTIVLRHIVQRDDVLRVADKVCRVLEAPVVLDSGRELHITASIGISFYPDDATTSDRLLQHADVAMYSAKGMGRNTWQTYVAVPEESHQQRLALESKLRQAERADELRVFYQPQIDAESEDVVGMEALIRWEHPELGMISPGFFIPLAEETGLIVSIGEWVLRQAVRDARRWQQQFGLSLRISVNLSPLQLRQPNLADTVQRALVDAGLEARFLELEVTESISVKSIPNLIEALQALRELGCQIAIDDFGTGQSSLDYIRRFPADRIKIDQVFVRNIGVDPDDEAIVRATIHMAHNLNRAVVAEGVEFEEHFAFLRDHGCEELQGYLFCRPLAASAFEQLLAERARLLAEVE